MPPVKNLGARNWDIVMKLSQLKSELIEFLKLRLDQLS
jgi:hypothetical protein